MSQENVEAVRRLYEAAKESNLPSGGLHRPAGFEALHAGLVFL
jgi:hypothetical protein